jgi:phosphoesterase RecJ-like protein
MNETTDKIKKEIDKAQSILLHCHPSPDPDSLGSTLAMKLGLESLGKKVTLIKGDSEIPKAFVFPGVETVTQKNFFEINLGDFDLFLILDSGSLEMISKKSEIVFPDSLMTVVIDHHASNIGYGKINLVDVSYSSTAQLVFDLLSKWNIEIDHDIALNIFMGMYTDTGGFRYGINPDRTLEVATKLAKLAPDYQKTISTMENSNRIESLIFESLALSSLQTFFDGKLVLSSVSNVDIVKNKFTDDDIFTGHISNKIKSVIGTQIAGTLIERDSNVVKISFRSRDVVKYDVSKLALALGGGGHKAAAGATLNMSLPDALEKVVKTVKELYNI